jgi:peptidoglycan/xylan/chitin deacetylase (PgdA/CDA1 family)
VCESSALQRKRPKMVGRRLSWVKIAEDMSANASLVGHRGFDVFAAMRKTIVRTALNIAYFSGTHQLLETFFGGIGAILMLHHVRPPRLDPFQPNRMLEITPTFLEEVIASLRHCGIDIVSLDEMHRRLLERDARRRFVCLTFDDGYRDNLVWAYSILKKHQVPFTIFVASSFPERRGELWWLTLERAISRNKQIDLTVDGMSRRYDCESIEAKRKVFDTIYWSLHGLADESKRCRVIGEIARRYAIDTSALCREFCLTWDELAKLATDPLVTIGAHTVNHVALKKVDEGRARTEMQESVDMIEAAVGIRPRHFAYPYGHRAEAGPREFRIASELGFKTAVTTRPGVLFAEHRDYLTALPRIMLDGELQRWRYVKAQLGGGPRALWSGFRRVDVA